MVAAVLEQLQHVVARQDAGGDNAVETHAGFPGGELGAVAINARKMEEEGKVKDNRFL